MNARRMLSRSVESGIGLVEIMVASTIAAVLIIGAVTVYSDSRNNYTVHETSSRLEESARYVLSVIEPDVRMSSYWGLTKGSIGIANSFQQTAAAATAIVGTNAATQCGTNFGADLQTTIEGSNDSYALGCQAYNNRPMPSADTLTVRRASFIPTTVAAATAGPLRICSTRLSAALATSGAGCPATPVGLLSDLIVHTYYVDRDSSTVANLPTLYRKSLNNVGTTPTFQDEEILQGVEDLQVQFGIDPTGTTGIATQYVDALNAATIPGAAQIISVRIWVLLRADTQEQGFTDNRTYAYANRLAANGTVTSLTGGGSATKAYAPADKYRRLLVSRTIMIRNALGT